MTSRPIKFLFPLILFLSLSCNLLTTATTETQPSDIWVPDAPQLNFAPTQTATVIEIIDGDTIVVMVDGVEERVRYIGIDTPEREDVCYQEATDANTALVENQTVRLVQDISDVDRYGRLLRYVYVNDILVNAELVAGGWADAKEYPPDTRLANLFHSLENESAADQRGCYPTGIFSNN
ncbi:MAG: thermonuclease family protein [Chloroflexi bacterium]|nr:thermonuclease family protein [Chloroflexota bacterium]